MYSSEGGASKERKSRAFRYGGRRSNGMLYRIAFIGVFSLICYLTFSGFTQKTNEIADNVPQVSHRRNLFELSLMNELDGPGCGSESVMGQYGIPVWLVSVIFCFFGLAVICDDFFVNSLERISIALDLSDDVAGATFMAAGSSAPELFISLIGVFFNDPESNPGPGTIVGSAVFNITVVIAVVIACANEDLQLSWWPFARDSVFYTIAIALMMMVFIGTTYGQIDWWESLIMVLAYLCYIIFMKYNSYFTGIIARREKEKALMIQQDDREDKVDEDERGYGDQKEDGAPSLGRLNSVNPRFLANYRVGFKKMHQMRLTRSDESVELLRGKDLFKKGIKQTIIGTKAVQSWQATVPKEGPQDDSPKGVIGWLIYGFSVPWHFLFRFTVPDCRKPNWSNWYPMTFDMSIFWIAVISFFMVDFANKLGTCIGISATIMGLTILAAGTSVPDALSSVMVARDGKGDMAVSNVLGSNVFDILLGLGFPWLISALVYQEPVLIDLQGIDIYASILFGVLVVIVAIFMISKFVLRKWLGVVLMFLYVGYVVFGVLYDTIGGAETD